MTQLQLAKLLVAFGVCGLLVTFLGFIWIFRSRR